MKEAVVPPRLLGGVTNVWLVGPNQDTPDFGGVKTTLSSGDLKAAVARGIEDGGETMRGIDEAGGGDATFAANGRPKLKGAAEASSSSSKKSSRRGLTFLGEGTSISLISFTSTS
jgi:hypothetical protein